LSNIRIADQRIGDIKAQAAALATGQARLAALLDRYGDATVDAAVVELKRRAARQMREKIATIAAGVYEGEAFVDSDGVVDAPPRSASASPRRCSPRSARRFPTSCSARRRERAATSASAASIRRRTAPT